MDSEALRDLFFEALKFRRAIENCDKNLLPDSFTSFPKGSSCDTSLILAQYLKVKGFGDFNYVSGERKGQSHSWLCQDGTVVDITADQFRDNNKKVIVMNHSDWHVDFNGTIKYAADYNVLDEETKAKLGKSYEEVLNVISPAVLQS